MKLTAEEELFLYTMFKENQERELKEWIENMEKDAERIQKERLERNLQEADEIFMNILEQRGL